LLFDFNRNYASILYRLQVIASYLSKVADFNLPHLHLAPPMGVFNLIRILQRSLASENYCLWAIMWCYLRDPKFNHFDTIPACDRQTDGRTDGLTDTYDDRIHRASIARRAVTTPSLVVLRDLASRMASSSQFSLSTAMPLSDSSTYSAARTHECQQRVSSLQS